jgi:CRP-like cAMP-binding protein
MAVPTADDLTRVPLLAKLSDDDRAALAPRFEIEERSPGSRLVTQGTAGYAFYVLADGRAAVEADGRTLRELGPGDHFGEYAIIGEGRRTATVTALTPVTVWALFGTEFRQLESSRPDLADELRRAMDERLADG